MLTEKWLFLTFGEYCLPVMKQVYSKWLNESEAVIKCGVPVPVVDSEFSYISNPPAFHLYLNIFSEASFGGQSAGTVRKRNLLEALKLDTVSVKHT